MFDNVNVFENVFDFVNVFDDVNASVGIGEHQAIVASRVTLKVPNVKP